MKWEQVIVFHTAMELREQIQHLSEWSPVSSDVIKLSWTEITFFVAAELKESISDFHSLLYRGKMFQQI